MKASMIDAMSMRDLRLWCLRGLAQHPELLSSADGTLFLSGECGSKIFNAMRNIYDSGEKVTPSSVAKGIGVDSYCLIGIVDVFVDAKVKRFMAECYLSRLERLNEEVANGTI